MNQFLIEGGKEGKENTFGKYIYCLKNCWITDQGLYDKIELANTFLQWMTAKNINSK